MGNKLAVGLSASALVVAVFGSTSAGRAALDAVIPVPLAKRAYLADTAKNAIKVGNIKASRTPTPGMLLPLDATGKLPASIGAVGQKGDKGDKGDKGSVGISGYEIVKTVSGVKSSSGRFSVTSAECPADKKVIGGGGQIDVLAGTYYDQLAIESSHPLLDTRWEVVGSVVNPPAAPGNYQVEVYAICAKVAS